MQTITLFFFFNSISIIPIAKSYIYIIMANSRIKRFVLDVPPPQFVSLMRRRVSNKLDTIVEEEISIDSNVVNKGIPSFKGSFSTSLFLREVKRSYAIDDQE
ncbi:hypothetical protein FRX31_031736 [Thalictrum thalictroides]|uniref:Uncharacterized protein n=1 Tax=Thalictrum thalictroides TaxID=46969 RepID=A0A7J6V1J0_THATH|nr:hypothetical protein FRX31_031736 [Thalictrum thalictroides]